MTSFLINELLRPARHNTHQLKVGDTSRYIYKSQHLNIIIDELNPSTRIAFLRFSSTPTIQLTCAGQYSFERLRAGGYLARPSNPEHPFYWIAALPVARSINADFSIAKEQQATLTKVSCTPNSCMVELLTLKDTSLDIVFWEFSDDDVAEQLTSLSAVERHGTFLWGSHERATQASDLYRHLICGTVYDLRYSWPHNKKCFSENEAHALYTTYSGLEKATGKNLYRMLQQQIVLAVIHRQAEDGAWYHGMWTDETECHYRLHTSAVHMLMDEFERTSCDQVKAALEKGVAFLAQTHDTLDCGIWFLHDSLELNEAAMNSGPFQWIKRHTLGKSPTNMLVLNTHLDTSIAINRYQTLTRDDQYTALLTSALDSTRAVLGLKPANSLYRPLFWAIGLTLLPTETARQLKAPIRAIKRIAADYLIKLLPDIKAHFPRLVMPNGYIDRELCLRTWAVDYQTINLMDLARYAQAFPNSFDEGILDKAMAFTHDTGLIKRYRELPPGKRYATGFWVEALYHRCLAKNDIKYRKWLAEGMLECHDIGFGMVPSLLGSNCEAIPFEQQGPYPVPANPELNIAVLAQWQKVEVLIVNANEME